MPVQRKTEHTGKITTEHKIVEFMMTFVQAVYLWNQNPS